MKYYAWVGGGGGEGTFDIPEDCPLSQSVPCMERNKNTTSQPYMPLYCTAYDAEIFNPSGLSKAMRLSFHHSKSNAA
jgi:hypothetical protein